jgi:hypothetical protein
VSPGLRLPFTQTLWYVAPEAVCRRVYRAVRRSRTPLSYMLHATDFLDPAGDAVDSRLARHPGMSLPFARKSELVEQCLSAIAADYRTRPYADLVAAGAATT